MRLWLILLVILALYLAIINGQQSTSSSNHRIAITKDCKLYIGKQNYNDDDYNSNDLKCATGVEFLVTPSINPSVLVFRRNVVRRDGYDRAYRLDVYGHYIEQDEEAIIDLEDEFETIDYEYALRRDGFDCEFASDERGGFSMAADGNTIHTLVRCDAVDENHDQDNPVVYFPGRSNKMLALMRSTLHIGVQTVATPEASLIFFKEPNPNNEDRPIMKFVMHPVDFNKAKTQSLDSALMIFFKTYGRDGKVTTSTSNFMKVNLHDVSPDGFRDADYYTLGLPFFGAHVRFIDYYNTLMKVNNTFTQSQSFDIREVKDTFAGTHEVFEVTSNRLKYVFEITSYGEANSDKDWKFRTKVDPISQSTGLLLTSCDPSFDEKKKECTDRAANHKRIIMIIAILAIFEVLIIIATLIVFSLCIFKQRKRRKLHHERKKQRKHRKHKKKTATATNNNTGADSQAGPPTSDTKQ